MKIVSSFILVVLYLTALTPAVLGQPINTFSFSGRTWTPAGSLTQTYNAIGGGNNITFNVVGDTSFLNSYTAVTPGIFTDTFGGLGVNNSVLALAMDQPNQTNSVTNRITFSSSFGVRNLSFRIFDIDQGSYQDQITVTAWRNGIQLSNTVVSVTANGNRTTVFGTNVVRGTNTGANDTGNGSERGDATFQISPLIVVDRIDINYGNGTLNDSGGTITNPGQQWTFLSDITFTAVPEPSTIFLLVGTPALLGSAWYFRNRKKLEKKAAELAAAGNTAEGAEQEENAVVAGV